MAARDEARDARLERWDAIETLSAGAAHDFSNLILIIGGFAEFLGKQHQADPELAEGFQEILEAVRRGKELVDQLALVGNSREISCAPEDLNSVCRGMADALQQTLGESIRLELRLAAQPVIVQADRKWLELMIRGLCAFGRDSMPEGGAWTLETGPAAPDAAFRASRSWATEARYGRLAVRDTGRPLQPEHAARACEPYFLKSRLKRGGGLPLAFAHALSRQLGGGIDLRAEAPAGTTLELYLPCPPPASV
jgi:signal transduction histidine kinase